MYVQYVHATTFMHQLHLLIYAPLAPGSMEEADQRHQRTHASYATRDHRPSGSSRPRHATFSGELCVEVSASYIPHFPLRRIKNKHISHPIDPDWPLDLTRLGSPPIIGSLVTGRLSTPVLTPRHTRQPVTQHIKHLACLHILVALTTPSALNTSLTLPSFSKTKHSPTPFRHGWA